MAKLPLGGGTYLLRFPAGSETRYNNHLDFVAQLKSRGVYPDLRVFGLRTPREQFIVITGSISETEKLSSVFHTPAAEAIVARQFLGNWQRINPESSAANVADPGHGVDFTAFEARLSAVLSAECVLDCEVGTGTTGHATPASRQLQPSRETPSAPRVETVACSECGGRMKTSEWWCRNCGDIQRAAIAAPGVVGLLTLMAALWAWSSLESQLWRYVLTVPLAVIGVTMGVVGIQALRDAWLGGDRAAVRRAHLASQADKARRTAKSDGTPKPTDRFGAAWEMVQRGKLHDAVDAFGAVPNADPSYSKAVFNRGLLLAQLGYPKDALALLQTLKKPDPETAATIDELQRAEAAGVRAPMCTGVALRG